MTSSSSAPSVDAVRTIKMRNHQDLNMCENAKTTVDARSPAETGDQVGALSIAEESGESEPIGRTSWLEKLIICGYLIAGSVAIYFMLRSNPCPLIYRMIL